MRLSSPVLRAAAIALATTIATPAHAATITKANNTNNLNLGTSWVGGAVPGTGDLALWDGTVTSAQSVALGGNLSWGGLSISSGNTVTITGSNSLTLGSQGLTVNGDLTFSNTLGAGVAGTFAGSGNLTFTTAPTRNWTGLSAITFTGTLRLAGGNNSNASSFTGGWFALGGASTTQTGAFHLDLGDSLTNRGELIVTEAWNTTTKKLTLASLKGFGYMRSDWGANSYRTVLVDQATNTTYSGRMISNSASRGIDFEKAGVGTLTLNGINFLRNTTVTAGTLQVDDGTLAFSSATGGTTTIASGALLNYNRTTDITDNVSLAGAGTFDKQGSAKLTFNNGFSTNFSGSLVLTAGNLLFAGSGTQTVSGVISGGATLSKSGSGTLVLSGANTLTGGTTLGGGTIRLANTNALAASTLAMSGSGTLAFDSAVATYAVAGIAAASAGAGYDVALVNNAGTPAGIALQLGAADTTSTYAGVFSGAGSLEKIGTGNLTLSGANTFTGGTTVTNGVLVLNASERLADTGALTVSGGALNLGANTETVGAFSLTGGSLVGNGTLAATSFAFSPASGNVTISAALAGTGAGLTKTGAGELTLVGASTYDGGTSHTEGLLSVSGSIGAVSVGSGARLRGTGSVGALSLADTAIVEAGISGLGSLSAGSLEVAAAAQGTLVILGVSNYTAAPALSLGAITVGAGGSLVIDVTGAASEGLYDLVAYTGAVDSADFTLVSSGLSSRNAAVLDFATAGLIRYSVSGAQPKWRGTSADLAAADAWVLVSGGVEGANTTYQSGDTLLFSDSAASGSLQISADIDPSALNFAAETLAYTLASTGGSVTSGSLAKTGAGLLTITASNSFAGGSSLSAGRTRIGAATALGSGSITLSGGAALSSDGATARSLSNAMVLAGDATLGDTTDSGELTLSGGIDLGAASRTLTVLSPVTLSGTVDNGALVKEGAGRLVLSGTNTHSLGTTLAAGELALGSDSALGSGTLTISGGILAAASAAARSASNAIVLSADVTLGAAGAGALTFSGGVDLGGARALTLASDTTFSGALANGSLTKQGEASLTLSGANTYTGGTTVAAGRLVLGASNVLADTGDVMVASGAELHATGFSDTLGALTVNGGTVTGGTLSSSAVTLTTGTLASALAGSGTLTKSGAGTALISGASTFTGAATVAEGTLQLGSATALGGTAGNTTVASGAILDLNGQSVGAEPLALAGSLVNTSGTAASIGGAVTVATAGSLAGTGNYTLSGGLTGAGNVTKSGSSTVTITAASSLTGAVTISEGTLAFSGNGAVESASGIALASGAILDWARSGSFTRALSGAGTVRRSSVAGNSTFSGNNSGFTGAWEVAAGYVGFSGDAGIGAAEVGMTFTNGAGYYLTTSGNTIAATRTFTLGSGGGTINGSTNNTNTVAAKFTGSGGLAKVSGEVAILTNPDNDFTGGITVTTGTLAIGEAGRLGSGAYAGAIAIGGTFRFDSSANQVLSGVISGAGSLQKQSTGTLTLSADNTFSGNVAVSGGTLRVSGRLFAGAYNNASSITVSNGATLELASFAYDGVGSTGQLSDYAQRRVLSGGGIAVTGNSHSSGNNFSVANGSTGFFDVSTAGQTLTLAGNGNSDILLGGALTVGGLGNLVINEVIANNTGTGSITKSGSGSLTLGAANTFGGGVTVQSGTLVLGNLSGFGSGTVNLSGGTLDLGGLVPTNVILLSGGSLANAAAWLAANTPTLSGNIGAAEINNLGADITELKVAAGTTVNLSGVTKDIVFEGGTLSNLSGYQGKVKVKGSLDLSSEDPLGEVEVADGGSVDFGARASSKTVKFTGGSVAGSGFTGTVEVVGSGVTLGSGIQAGTVRVTSGNSAAIASGFGRDISFAGGSLSGLANYSGTVSLETGATLSVGDTTSADFTLASGSTLKGSGSVGTITQTAGSVLAPGNSPGLLTTEALVLGAGSSLEVEFFAATGVRGTAYDAVTVTGALDLSGLSTGNRYTLNLVSLAALPSTQGALAGFDAGTAYVYELFNYASLTLPASYTGNITSLFTIDKSLFQDADGNAVTGSFTVFRNDATNMLELQYTPIPEPSTYGLVLGGLALAGAAIRRRRAKRA